MVISHVWVPTTASVTSEASAVSVAVCAALPPSVSVIQAGQLPPLVLENVTSADSSSTAVSVILRALSSTTVPESASPFPSLFR